MRPSAVIERCAANRQTRTSADYRAFFDRYLAQMAKNGGVSYPDE